jgi:hypothetical protein
VGEEKKELSENFETDLPMYCVNHKFVVPFWIHKSGFCEFKEELWLI